MPTTRNNSFVFALFVIASGSSTGGSHGSMVEVQPPNIAPPLHPNSDKKFFDKDYPDDLRPETAHSFDVPYPTVQDDDDYDKDFVRDENSEKGSWVAQMEYDALKNRLARERAEMNRAKQKMEEERHEYEDISGKEADAERATQVLEDEAEKAADVAAEKEDAAAVSERQASGSAEDVEREIEDLKKCEDELKKAKEELKKILEQLKAADTASGEAADKADAAESEVEAAEKEEAIWEEKLDRASQLHKSILLKYEEKRRELNAMEANLADAAKILSNFRAPDMDSTGAVVDDKSGEPVSFHSFASMAHPVVPLVAALLCFWAAQ